MSLRRAGTLVLVLALSACTSVTQEPQTNELVFATFDTAKSIIPTPNDLVLQRAAGVSPAAQREVLQGYVKSGGFPSDVEVAITIPFNAKTWDATSGTYVDASAPTLEASSVTASTVTVLKVDGATATPVPYEAVITPGKLVLRKPAASATDLSRRWAGGRYVVAVRGGPSGVKTTGGSPVSPDGAIALTIPNLDLSVKENQPIGGLPPATAASANGLRRVLWDPEMSDWMNSGGSWLPVPSANLVPFKAIDTVFPHAETAVVTTFGIDKSAHVALDSAASQVPFPSDFLLEVSDVTKCPLGTLPCVKDLSASVGAAAGAGLRTLDGFSTTAALLAPLTGVVDATTINKSSVLVFEMGPAGGAPAPVLLKDVTGALGTPGCTGAAYVTQPPGTSQGGLTTTLVLQPGVYAPFPAGTSPYCATRTSFSLPPLKEKTSYMVVVTSRVKNPGGAAMTRGAVANILLSTSAALWGPNPASPATSIPYIQGPDLATAQGLQAMRDGYAPFFSAALPAITTAAGNPTTKDDVVMYYTVRTQTVTPTSVSLSAAPYSAGLPAPTATALTPAQFETATGFPAANLPGVAHVVTGTFTSLDPISTVNGAIKAQPWGPTQLDYLATVPIVAGTCTPATCKLPVVIFHHGLNGSRFQMLGIAAALAQAGFIAVATDAPFHGSRSACKVDSECTTGAADGVCTLDPTNQAVPGSCTTGQLKFDPARLSYVASGNDFISSNFFRSRDAIRRDLLDQSALVLAVAPAAPRLAADDPFVAALEADLVSVDNAKLRYLGQSLGSIIGTSVLATNPRFESGVLNVGGGTVVDVFTSKDSVFTFQPGGVAGSSELEKVISAVIPGFTFQAAATDPVMLATYQKLLQVAKWILDPADPVNYAAHVQTKLASPVSGALGPLAFATTGVLAQVSQGDDVVPNSTNYELDALIGLNTVLYQKAAGANVPHGYLLSGPPGNPMQVDAITFLAAGIVPTSPVTVP
jgi:dienelactone hydrolase